MGVTVSPQCPRLIRIWPLLGIPDIHRTSRWHQKVIFWLESGMSIAGWILTFTKKTLLMFQAIQWMSAHKVQFSQKLALSRHFWHHNLVRIWPHLYLSQFLMSRDGLGISSSDIRSWCPGDVRMRHSWDVRFCHPLMSNFEVSRTSIRCQFRTSVIYQDLTLSLPHLSM